MAISLSSWSVRTGLGPWVLTTGVLPDNLSFRVVLGTPYRSAALLIDSLLLLTSDIAFCTSSVLYALYGILFLDV